MMKKVIIYLSALAMILNLCGCTKKDPEDESETVEQNQTTDFVFDESRVGESIAAAESFAGGDGSRENPYQIANAEQLALLSKKVNNDETDYCSASYILTDDIVLNDTSNFNEWDTQTPKYQWNKIGSVMPKEGDECNNYTGEFGGVFDGQNHTISGIYVYEIVGFFANGYTVNQKKVDTPYLENGGLFGSLDSAEIKNVNIENAYLEIIGIGLSNTGILAANAHNTIIDHVNVTGKIVAGNSTVGGVIGNLKTISGTDAKQSSITNSSFDGEIILNGKFTSSGGIVGYLSGSKVSQCVNEGSITGIDDTEIGGIIGLFEGEVNQCINNGNLSHGEDVGGIVGSIAAGGMTGVSVDSKKIVVSECVNNGSISHVMELGAGIIGHGEAGVPIEITDCENHGTIAASDSAEDSCTLAGIIAMLNGTGSDIENNLSLIKNCHNYSDLESMTAFIGGIAGAVLLGDNSNVLISECENHGNIKVTAPMAKSAGGIIHSIQSCGSDSMIMTVEKCENHGNVYALSGLGIGGIIGEVTLEDNKSESEINVRECLNDGDVTGGWLASTGGILGQIENNKIPFNLTKCISSGTISVEPGEEDENPVMPQKVYIAGVVGQIFEADIVIQDCSHTGAANIPENTPTFEYIYHKVANDLNSDGYTAVIK